MEKITYWGEHSTVGNGYGFIKGGQVYLDIK
jgi:hypothetical protein